MTDLPQRAEERLREQVLDIVKHFKFSEKYGTNPDLPTDAILAIVTAEIGAAIGKDVQIHPDDYQSRQYWHGVNWQKAELRNHFGIEEEQA